VRVPAEVQANWTFQLAWSGDERPYLAGVKRAAASVVVIPTVLLVLAMDVSILGFRVALAHAGTGLCVGLLLVELLFVRYRKLPFASGYARAEDLKSVGPLYIAALLISAGSLAAIERAALASAPGTIALLAALLAMIGATHAVAKSQRETLPEVDFDERPSGAAQWFELSR
jgi:hypothetical protein